MSAGAADEPLLTAVGVDRSYTVPRETPLSRTSRRAAVTGATLEVREGETLAVIGESGSGKSTLVRVLLGLDPADSGEVRFRGRPVTTGSARSTRWLRRETGVVLQDPYASLDPRFTVAQSIAEPLKALAIPGDHAALVVAVLAHVGLHDWRAEQYPHELSGGQRQRVALARAIVHRPSLLVGDEPLSALDVTVRAQILELLRALGREYDLSMVLVSHDIGLVQHLADRIVVMHDGRIVETGDARDVLSDPRHEYTRRLLASIPVLPTHRLRGEHR